MKPVAHASARPSQLYSSAFWPMRTVSARSSMMQTQEGMTGVWVSGSDFTSPGRWTTRGLPVRSSATVVLEVEMDEADISQLVRQVDRDMVASYMMDFDREDLLVTIFRGNEIMAMADES